MPTVQEYRPCRRLNGNASGAPEEETLCGKTMERTSRNTQSM